MIGLALWIAAAATAADEDRAAAACAAVGFDVVDVNEGAVVVADPRQGVQAENLRETLMGAYDEFGVVGGVAVVDEFGNDAFGAGVDPSVDPKPTGAVVRRFKSKAVTTALPFGGALLGKRIALSAGHGWLDDDGNGTFATQRSNFQFSPSARGITEDFFTTETVTNQIIPLLLGMGADVVVVRAPDHDVGEENVVSGVVEAGEFVGVANGRQAVAEGEGRVVYALNQSPRAVRRLAIRFPAVVDGAGSVVVEVNGAGGGSFVFNLDQRRGPGSWQELGFFAVDAASKVVVSAGPGAGRLAVDRVMVGGGTHESGHPWWQMAAHSYVPERGVAVPGAVAGKNDVTIRPSYAELFDVDAFLSIHANASGVAGGSTANGLTVYRYNCSDSRFPDHSSSTAATGCDDPPGSTDLCDEVHAATIDALQAQWDPEFNSRGAGTLVANFGELRDLINAPGVLIETAFFDNLAAPTDGRRASDNKALHDPRWREAFATGVVTGLARFFDATSTAPPARPVGVFAKNVDGDLVISWNAVERAGGYRVYRAFVDVDGVRAFDEGTVVNGATSLAFTDLRQADVVAVKVAALDDNGEGYASSVVAAKVGPAVGLIVDAYDRRDAFVQDIDNTLSYSFEHAAALAAALPAGFDGVDDDALSSAGGDVDLGAYAFVDFFAGKDSTEHQPIAAAQQQQLRAYVDRGGRLFVSGEEVGYALVDTSDDAADAAFFADVLGAVYEGDDSGAYDVVVGGVDSGVDDGSGGVYEVVFPDVVSAAAGATVFGTWPDGSGAATKKGSAIFLATPFEALVPASSRAAVMAAVVDALAVPVPAEGEGEEGEGEGEEGEGEEGEGEEGEGDGVTILPASVDGGAEDGCGGCGASSASSSSLLLWGLLGLSLRGRASRARPDLDHGRRAARAV